MLKGGTYGFQFWQLMLMHQCQRIRWYVRIILSSLVFATRVMEKNIWYKMLYQLMSILHFSQGI